MSNLLYLLNEKDNKQSKKSYISSISNITNDKSAKEYQNDIDIKTSYKIYVQSIEKTVELLKDIINILEEQNYAENSEILADSIHKKISIIDSIIAEFIKLFSVIKDHDLKEIYNHLYMKFNGIEIQLKLCFIKQEVKYAKNCLKLCEYLLKIFKTLEQQAINLVK
jgi:hypothetical protein